MTKRKSEFLPKVSIVIISETWNKFLEESLPYYDSLNYQSFEVFVFSTDEIGVQGKQFKNVRFIFDLETKNSPAKKRDLALKYCDGEFFAFIDDDAFPSKDWLKNAVDYFEDKDVAAVGGPGLTPETAGIMENASGWISASPVGGFGNTYRFVPQKKREVDDFPSVNLIVRSTDFKKVNGFDSNYYPGEDTKLCLDLTKKLGKKIIYDPDILVYHHKRPLFKKHLIQNGRFGLHRGHFARILPETSARLFYFIPSLFSFGICGGFILILANIFLENFLLQTLVNLFILSLGIYFAMLVLNSIWIFTKCKNIYIAMLSIPGVFLTHFWYGIKFIQGYFFIKKLEDKYGRSVD